MQHDIGQSPQLGGGELNPRNAKRNSASNNNVTLICIIASLLTMHAAFEDEQQIALYVPDKYSNRIYQIRLVIAIIQNKIMHTRRHNSQKQHKTLDSLLSRITIINQTKTFSSILQTTCRQLPLPDLLYSLCARLQKNHVLVFKLLAITKSYKKHACPPAFRAAALHTTQCACSPLINFYSL